MGNQAESLAAAGLRRDVDRDVVQAWLDALSSGACDETAFLRAVQKLTRRSAEAGWDTLALIDQYYRRGKLSGELFNSLKMRFGSELVGQGTSGEVSVPLPEPASPAVDPPPALRPVPAIADQTAVIHAEPPPEPANQSIPVAAPTVVATAPPVAAPTTAAPTVAAPTVAAPTLSSSVERAKVHIAKVPEPREPGQVPVDTWAPSFAESSARRRELPITQPNAAARAETRRALRREIAVGDLLRGRYQIKGILGRGGTGMVFEAIDLYRIDMPDSGQRVALKVLHTYNGKPGRITELQREFQLLQSLSHPNIIRAHDYDRDGDLAFFTMEYLRGLSLVGVLSARNQVPLERAHALTVIRDVGAALCHAHSRSVVHGDLNPGNIFITNEGEVRVLDFGAAHPPSTGPVVSASQSDQVPVATPRYASPQVLDGKRADVRDDLYALACIAYQLISGKHPFAEKTALIAQEQRLKPSRPSGLGHKEWQALRTALAFDRERRPADVAAWMSAFDWRKAAPRLPVLLALVRVTQEKRSSSLWPALAIAAVVLAGVGLWLNHAWHQPPPRPDASDAAASAGVTGTPLASSESQGSAAATPDRSTASSEPVATAPSASAEAPAAAAGNETPESASAAQPVATPAPPPVTAKAAPAQSSSAEGSAAAAPATATSTAASSAAATPTAAATGAAAGDVTPARTRIELAADTIDVPLTDPAARVIVRRKGSLRGNVTFTWWTESGTAKPGTDFMAVAPHQEVVEDGKSSVNLFIPVVGDSTRQQPKSFYVVINDPGEGATLGARTLTMITIPPSE